MKKGIWIGLMVLIATACGDPKQEVVDNLRNEAIDLHDEVMPRMGEIMTLSSQLKDLREEMRNDSVDSATLAMEPYSDQIVALEAAHEGMMQWMADYEPDYDKEHPLDSAVVYYEAQRASIVQVKEDIEQSIEKAIEIKKNAGN